MKLPVHDHGIDATPDAVHPDQAVDPRLPGIRIDLQFL